ncbi:MAG: DUF2235 domain-containing protein [Glaciimonas sp.]|nr:DUF2235 domain-containing protein [Glaciimonas sp.]
MLALDNLIIARSDEEYMRANIAQIHNAPMRVTDNIETEMTLSIAEMRRLLTKDHTHTKGTSFSRHVIKIGLFFDGTNNNRDGDIPLQAHTNVVKLFNAYKDVNGLDHLKAAGQHRFYIPGLGTRFPENREWRESHDGKAFGKGEQARILYALLEIYNVVYRECNDNIPLFSSFDISAKLQQYTREIETGDPLHDPHAHRPTRRSWFATLNTTVNATFDARLQRLRTTHPSQGKPRISIVVCGFSRGAALARAFLLIV